MGKLLNYANEKNELIEKVMEETRRLVLEGMSYRTALEKAKDMYQWKES